MGMTDLLLVIFVEKVAPIVLRVVDTSAAGTIATHGTNILLAVHIASGGGSTHASSSSSNVIGALQNHKVVRHNAITAQCLMLPAVVSGLWW